MDGRGWGSSCASGSCSLHCPRPPFPTRPYLRPSMVSSAAVPDAALPPPSMVSYLGHPCRRLRSRHLHVPVLQKSTATKLTRTTVLPSAAGIIVEPQSQATDRATCARTAAATPAPSNSSNPPNDNTPSTTTHYAANPPTATTKSPTHIAPLASRTPINSSVCISTHR